MRITAYDMAHYDSIEPLEGHPGYKKLDADVVRRMVVDALKDVPLGELPGGTTLAGLVESLPGASPLDATNMSFNEIKDALGSRYSDWLEEKFGPFIDEHRVESAAIAFGSITAIRYASPDAAEVLDRVTPPIRVWSDAAPDGSWRASADLRYRDARVLPDLDLRGAAYTDVGAARLRATATGTVSIEADEHVSGRVGVGARIGDNRTWGDVSASINHNGRVSTRLAAGHRSADDLFIRGHVAGDFGEGAARSGADGRITARLEATKAFERIDGDFGLWAGYGVDTNGRNEDARVGIMFRLRW